jgi:nitrous oxidase accessory protein NosD
VVERALERGANAWRKFMTLVSQRRFARVAAGGLASVMALALFAGTASAAMPTTLYVSKEHASDTNPCSASMPCLTIGHAISMAGDGATIKVDEGTYAEQVSVTTKVHLVGEHAVIDATGQKGGIAPLSGMGIVGYGLLVFGPGSAGTSVSGFTVENAIGEGILVAGTSKVLVEHNVIRHDDAGFNTTLTMECQAQGNIPGDCGEGLHLVGVTWSHIIGNLIENNVGGILVTDEIGPSAHNTIAWNVSKNNAQDCGITLPSHNALAMSDPTKGGVYDNLVTHNVSMGNGGAGVGMFAPFPGTASYNNTVSFNTLKNNGEAGIGIHAHAPGQNVSGNSIVGNWVSGNGIDPDSGSGHPTGIALFSAVVPVTVVVAHNHVSNEFWGIFKAGSLTITGLSTNQYGANVTNDTN